MTCIQPPQGRLELQGVLEEMDYLQRFQAGLWDGNDLGRLPVLGTRQGSVSSQLC